jgi:hypothetical protein
MDAKAATDERGASVRQNRLVLTPQWQVSNSQEASFFGNDGDKQAKSRRGEHDISCKAIAQGRPDCFR